MTSTQPPHLISALEDLDREFTPEQPEPEPVEVPRRRQPGSLVEVWLTGADEPFEVRITNPDRIAFEMTAARHKEWPKLADGARNFAMTFLTWAATRRLGLTELNFDAWQKALVDFDVIEETGADPTR